MRKIKHYFSRGLKSKCVSNRKLYELEKTLLEGGDKSPQIFTQAVEQRRHLYQQQTRESRNLLDLKNVPYQNYDYSQIWKRNCENVVGYVRVPVGIVDSVRINSELYDIPIATTEGSLISSLNRGAKVIRHNGREYGIRTLVTDIGMTRAPILQFPSLESTMEFRKYLQKDLVNPALGTPGKGVPSALFRAFSETTRYGQLKSVSAHQLGRKIHLRIVATTGEAMGMNMITQGSEAVVREILKTFSDVQCISISGNLCTDKKPNAVNLILGRGKHAVAETEIPGSVVREILKVQPDTLVALNTEKNYLGSALAGSIGGQNAHLANVISGIYLATGQDLGHIGTSSVGITEYQYDRSSDLLRVTLTMPCLELGTVGGGTHLSDQRALLQTVLGRGRTRSIVSEGKSHKSAPRSEALAGVCAATCLIGELSLMSALANNELMNAHRRLNRSSFR